jgi:hypothetical protein
VFVVDCPGHRSRTLLSVHSIIGIDHPEPGVIDVTLRCWCGHAVVHRSGVATARARQERVPAAAGV